MRKMLTKSFAVDQLGRDIVFPVYLTDLINGQDVRVIQCRSCPGLLDKSIQFV